MRLSLSSRISILCAGLLIGFGIVIQCTFQVLSARQVDRTIRSDAATANRQLATILDDRAERLRTVTTYAATSAARVRGLIFSGDSATVQDQLPNVAHEFGLDAVEMFDADGRLLGQFGLPGHMQFTGYSGNSQTSLDVETTSVGNGGSDGLYLAAARTVAIGTSQRGSIRFLKKIGINDARQLAHGTGADLAFVVDGKVVVSSLDGTPKTPSEAGVPTQITVGDKSLIEFLAPLGLKTSQQIQVLTIKDPSLITKPYRNAQTIFTGVLIVGILVAIAVGHWFGKGLVRPLEAIVTAAKEVQEGAWPEPLPIVRKDEIGVLQSAFNEMVFSARSAQERLLALVDRDPLTELTNHRRFRESLVKQLEECGAARQTLALLLLDIDRFAKLNDNAGHAAGDECLVNVAKILRQASPSGALLARYGSDCFAVALIGANSQTAATFANEVTAALTTANLEVTVSIGSSEFPRNTAKAEGLVLAAELGLARAKQLGVAQISTFDDVPGSDQTDPVELYRYLENGSLATIQALAAAVDAKDSYTNGHSERVARYASELAAFCGLSEEEVDRVFRCGTLHDVGKIGVPDAILQKPGRLDPEEYRVMETHPVLGEMIVAKVPQLADLLSGVRHHHERWDGCGYPDKVAGEAIPMIARILALADTFDAMTSDRPYRKGMEVAIALGEIEKCAGKQFDPELAKSFVAMLRAQMLLEAA
jgi:diguanylate cyclase (GGDEF)-like protein